MLTYFGKMSLKIGIESRIVSDRFRWDKLLLNFFCGWLFRYETQCKQQQTVATLFWWFKRHCRVCVAIFGLSYALKSKSNLNSNEFVPEDFATETVGAQDQSQISIYCKWLLSFEFSSQFNVVAVFRHPQFFLYEIDVQHIFLLLRSNAFENLQRCCDFIQN